MRTGEILCSHAGVAQGRDKRTAPKAVRESHLSVELSSATKLTVVTERGGVVPRIG